MIAVQLVEICWTKSARGAAGGRQRAALPRAFAWQTGGSGADLLLQRHRMDEWNGWAPMLEVQETAHFRPTQLCTMGELALRLADGHLQAGYLRSPWGAKPPRHPAPCVMQLPPHAFGRIILNARYTSYSGQIYVEQTWNLMWADDALPPDAFTRRLPAICHDARLHLF